VALSRAGIPAVATVDHQAHRADWPSQKGTRAAPFGYPDVREDEAGAMTTDKLAVDRDELARVAMFLVKLIDADDTPEPVREEARQRFDELNVWLAYGGREVANVTQLFVRCGYSRAVEEILAEYPPEVLEYQAVRVMIARHAADLADTPHFSDLYRLDMVDSLNQILASIKRCAAGLVVTE
jgi:hypothetical protein